MSARITIDGDSIEVAGRFDSEAEIDAFIDRLWTVWFAVHDDAPAPGVDIFDLPALRAATPAERDMIAARMPGPCPDVDARPKAGHDADGGDAPHDSAEAFARLTPQQRRAVLLKRKLGAVKKVAAEMGVTDTSVYLHLKAAREKGVYI